VTWPLRWPKRVPVTLRPRGGAAVERAVVGMESQRQVAGMMWEGKEIMLRSDFRRVDKWIRVRVWGWVGFWIREFLEVSLDGSGLNEEEEEEEG